MSARISPERIKELQKLLKEQTGKDILMKKPRKQA
jgi:hypothetical protein